MPRKGTKDYYIPAEGICEEVLQADVEDLFGSDVEYVSAKKQDGKKYFVISAYEKPDKQSISNLKQRSQRWRNSEEYDRNKSYSRHRTQEKNVRGGDDRFDSRRPSISNTSRPLQPIQEGSQPIHIIAQPSRHIDPGDNSLSRVRSADSTYGSLQSSCGSLSRAYGIHPGSYGRTPTASHYYEPNPQTRPDGGSSGGSKPGGGSGGGSKPGGGMSGWPIRPDRHSVVSPVYIEAKPDQRRHHGDPVYANRHASVVYADRHAPVVPRRGSIF